MIFKMRLPLVITLIIGLIGCLPSEIRQDSSQSESFQRVDIDLGSSPSSKLLTEHDSVFKQAVHISSRTFQSAPPLNAHENNNYSQPEIKARLLGDPGNWWNIPAEVNINHSLAAGVTNNYYIISVPRATKITTRLWNIPANANIDTALYQVNQAGTTMFRVGSSELLFSNEEQISFVAEPGDYVFEVAVIGAHVPDPYTFAVTFQDNFDAQEHDDNFWQARIQNGLESVTGTLDNNFDKDFMFFSNPITRQIDFSIIGGDYEATLYFEDGTVAINLLSNQVARINLLAGSYFWRIYSPSESVDPLTTYTFSQVAEISTISLEFQSDEQAGYSRRVDWGAGEYFPIEDSAVVSGFILDSAGDPVRNASVQFNVKSSRGIDNDIAVIATADEQGYFSRTIYSPLGYGKKIRSGAALLYHFDVHTVEVHQRFDDGTLQAIPLILENDDVGQTSTTTSNIRLNDIAYYTYL